MSEIAPSGGMDALTLRGVMPGAFGLVLVKAAISTIALGTLAINNVLAFSGANTNFIQFDIQNTSAGIGAQSGFSCTADTGTPTSIFGWLGINNSGTALVANYNIGSALDVTLIGTGNDLYIANGNPLKDIIVSCGKAVTPFWDERLRIQNAAGVGGAIWTLGNSMIVRKAATQDGVALAGLASGSSSRTVTIVPQPLTASRTHQLIDADLILAGSASALTSTQVVVGQTGGLLGGSAGLTYSANVLTVGDGTTTQALQLSSALAQNTQLHFFKAATRLFTIFTDARGGGSDAGSNLNFSAYTDAGVLIDTPFSITRATGGPINFLRPMAIAQGTITAAALGVSGTVTWNSGATSFRGWQLNVTDTASAATSSLIDLQLGGATRFQVLKTGEVGLSVAPTAGAGLLQLSAGTTIANGIAMNGCGIFANAANALTLNATAGLTLTGGLTIADAKNVAVGTTTGTVLGTTALQKLGFWGAAAIAQIVGYGTPTGASLLTNFPGATATLAQQTAAFAQLLLNLKSMGLIGA